MPHNKRGYLPSQNLRHGSPNLSNPKDKIEIYEDFLNETLKTDLKRVLEQRDQIYTKISEYMEQETILKKLLPIISTTTTIPTSTSTSTSISTSTSSPVDSIRVKVDIGCNFYAQAEVSNINTILFDIGCGIWLPVTLNEGLNLCQKHIKILNKKVKILTKQELQIKANINIVVEALTQIQGMSGFEDET